LTDHKKEILELFTKVVHALTIQIESFRHENKPLGQGLFILDYCAKRKTCIMSDLVRDLNFTPSTATRQTDKLVISHRMKNIGPIIKAFDEDELGVLLKLLKSTVDRLH